MKYKHEKTTFFELDNVLNNNAKDKWTLVMIIPLSRQDADDVLIIFSK